MESVSHFDREIAYEYVDRGGTGPPICCIHGSSGTRSVWKSQHRLADRYPVVPVDLSGHGDSDDIDASPGYTTLSAYASDVIAVAEATDAKVLLGTSLGGAVAMHIAIERDFHPDALVLTSTGARLGVLEDLLRWIETDFDRAVEFLTGEGRFYSDPDPRLREQSIKQMHAVGREVAYRDFLTCHRFDVRDKLGEIDAPTLVIHGTEDRLTPPWYHDYLADNIPDARLVAIEEAAHLVMLERPTAFNEAVVTFLDSLDLEVDRDP